MLSMLSVVKAAGWILTLQGTNTKGLLKTFCSSGIFIENVVFDIFNETINVVQVTLKVQDNSFIMLVPQPTTKEQ